MDTTPRRCGRNDHRQARLIQAARWAALAVMALPVALGATAILSSQAHAAGPVRDASCSQEGSVRSLNDNTPAVITFVNQTSQTLQAIWLDFSGHRVLYGKISPGTSAMQKTWETHPWILADLGGNCLKLFVTNATAPTMTVTEPATPTPAPTPTAAPTPTPTPATPATAAPGVTPPSGGSTAPSPAPISLFGTSLASPASAFQSPAQLGVTVAVIFVLIIFIPFPAELFNSTYEENHARIRRWWTAHAPWLVNAYQFVRDEEGRRGRAVSLAGVVLIGGVLGAALDPGFGANLHTVLLAISIALALVLCTAAGAIPTFWFRRRHSEDLHWRLSALPGGLAITAAGVLLSRLTNYEPGYLYGLILLATFVGVESRREEGREVAISSAALIVFSVAAWLAWIPLQSAATQPSAGAGLVFLADLLTAIFVVGIVRAVILLVPIRFLPGNKLAAWSRLAWAIIFGVGAFAMAEIMILPESGQYLRSNAPVVTTLVLFFLFGVSSVAFWAYFRYTKGPAAEA